MLMGVGRVGRIGSAPILSGAPSWVPRDENGSSALLAFGPTFGYWYNGRSYPTMAAMIAAIGSTTLSVDTDGTYIDAAGVRRNATANVLRHEYRDGQSIGWRLEGTRTNQFVNPTAPATQTITHSSSTYVQVQMEGSGSLTLSGSVVGTVTEDAPVYVVSSGSSLTVTVNGDVDFVQVESGNNSRIPTSPILTATTRNADVLTFGPNGSSLPFTGFVQGEGTIVVWGRTGPYINGLAQYLFGLDDTTSSNRIDLLMNQTGTSVGSNTVYTGTTQSSFTGLCAQDTDFSAAIAFAQNDEAFSFDGLKESVDTGVTIPNITRLKLNGSIATISQWEGWLSKFAYFPRRVQNITKRNFYRSFPDRVHILGDSFASAGFWSSLSASLAPRIVTVDGVGGAVASAHLARWIATPALYDRILVYTDDTSEITSEAQIPAMLSMIAQILALSTSGKFLLMEPGDAASIGTATRTLRDAKWAAVLAAYPNNTVSVLAAMQASGDGSDLDNAYIAAGRFPGSCLVDPGTGPDATVNGHLNAKGEGIYDAQADAKGRALGYWA